MTSAATIGEVDPGWLEDPATREAVVLERIYVQGARHLHGLTGDAARVTRRRARGGTRDTSP